MRRDRAWLGAVMLLVLAGGFALVFARVPQNLLASKGTLVRARVTNALGLTKGDPVRLNGVDVGTVRAVHLDPGARSATVDLGVKDAGLPVYADASVEIRERTLLGANFAVALDRGTPSAGRLDGGVITAGPAATQVELEDLVNAFRPGARDGLRSVLREFPRGLADTTAPRDDLRALATVAPDLDAGLGAARGERDGDLRRLVAHSATVVQALDTGDARIRDVVQGAAATLTVTAARRADLQRTLRIAAPALANTRRTLGELDTTLALADPLIAKLDRPAPDIGPTLARLRPVLTGADALLADARPLLAALRPAAQALAHTARAGTPLLRGLTPSIERIQGRILRDLRLKSPESGHSTFEMIGPALEGVVGAAAGYDRNNNFIRFLASGGEKAIESAPCTTSFLDPTAASPVNCDQLVGALGEVFGP
ncbi:MAG: phospholipid/cholesterol/gamma-HCH transport system substrate-binding protein [Solirubrobacteraceae bacterium]|jgi:phospholipid/cholesterol/gamma-HCH transport system substrate-binding protein|nr:phospholipid/cholesterol/gamma-HCH transport system substrate-binding protein [Solirubrobacteraceae bacterium]